MSTIEKFLTKQEEIIQKDREKTLIELGLVEKEYEPQGERDPKYNKYEYQGTTKVYYRNVAIEVTDEEYKLILAKVAEVEAIRAKNEACKGADRAKIYRAPVRRWVPAFKSSQAGQEAEEGRSGIAVALRVFAWLIGIGGLITGIVAAYGAKSFIPVLITIGSVVLEMVAFYAVAEILDRLAELTAIARHGQVYTEK